MSASAAMWRPARSCSNRATSRRRRTSRSASLRKAIASSSRPRSPVHGRRLYATDLAEMHPADFEMGNWFTSADPESIFVNGLLAARAEPDRRYALFNNALSTHKLNGGTEKRKLNARELRDALGDLFKIRLEGLDGLDTALDAACGERRHEPRQKRPTSAGRRPAAGGPARPRSRSRSWSRSRRAKQRAIEKCSKALQRARQSPPIRFAREAFAEAGLSLSPRAGRGSG